MLRSDFFYDLPPELIAQHPAPHRVNSRLLAMNKQTGALQDLHFSELENLLQPGDLLVLNNTQVIPARLYGQKATGGAVEVLVERVLSDQRALAHVRASKALKPGQTIYMADHAFTITMLERKDSLFVLEFPPKKTVLEWLNAYGELPLPPYIVRDELSAEDLDRYQTVFARHPGAVAAPTAGLHFSQEFLARLQQKGVEQTFVTLHVGAGTFQPVRSDRIEDHQMHSEWFQVLAETCDKIQAARARGGRVIAVGTTAVRSLESAASAKGQIAPCSGETRIFIKPGDPFKIVDALLTNFHLPESTLLMLVSAFAGYEQTMQAYRHAVAQKYRFFSYGDAMFLS